jgi:predicted transcriptional regulator
MLKHHRGEEIIRSAGIDRKHFDSIVERLLADGLVKGSKDTYQYSNTKLCRALCRLLRKIESLAQASIPKTKARFHRVPSIFGTRTRTKLVSLLALNGPSSYSHLIKATGLTKATVYCDLGLLQRIGIVRLLGQDGKRGRWFSLDPSYPAFKEIAELGRKIGVLSGAPTWNMQIDGGIERSINYAAGARKPWLFKRNRKSQALLLAHAAGSVTHGQLATALGIRYQMAQKVVRHLLNDGLLEFRRSGGRVRVVPAVDDPFRRDIAALMSRLLNLKHPEIKGLARSLSSLTKPKTLYGKK